MRAQERVADSDTALIPQGVVIEAPPRAEYREAMRRYIRMLVEQKGVEALIDWINKATVELYADLQSFDHVDVTIEELRAFFDERYPLRVNGRKWWR